MRLARTLFLLVLAHTPAFAQPAVRAEHLVPDAIQSGIVINIPQAMLFLKQNGALVASYPVGLGRPSWPTFVGEFSIVRMEEDPAWDVPPSIQEEMRRAGKRVLTRVPPGPTNPLGKYWLGLSEPNYGIHGTNAPSSVGRYQTHGCIRLRNDDIAALWPLVSVGMPGMIVYETWVLEVTNQHVRFEALKDIYKREQHPPLEDVVMRAEALGIRDRINWATVATTLAAREGRPVDITRPPHWEQPWPAHR